MRRSRGHSLAEYAILTAAVTAALLGIFTYVRRTLQGRIYDAVRKRPLVGGLFGPLMPLQYEPYYYKAPPGFNVAENNVFVKTTGHYTVKPDEVLGAITRETQVKPNTGSTPNQSEWPPPP